MNPSTAPLTSNYEQDTVRRPVNHKLTLESFTVDDHLVRLINQDKKIGDPFLPALFNSHERQCPCNDGRRDK
jgi:hypothetical protein